ncbi:hypothetical protein CUN63_00005, partial [Pseudomonas sp. ACM7]
MVTGLPRLKAITDTGTGISRPILLMGAAVMVCEPSTGVPAAPVQVTLSIGRVTARAVLLASPLLD